MPSYNGSSLERLERRRRKKRKKRIKRFLRAVLAVLLISVIVFACVYAKKLYNKKGSVNPFHKEELNAKVLEMPDWVTVDLIDFGIARKGLKLQRIDDIVIHYTANPMSTAKNNRDYFDKITTEVCSHFLVGLDGEIIQCVPIDERSAASNNRNFDTISIEVCHPDETGKFNDATYSSLVKLTAWLCENSDLDENHIIRHYDITGKKCPLYFVEHEDEWERFKKDVKTEIEGSK